jgi:hypothetical protein
MRADTRILPRLNAIPFLFMQPVTDGKVPRQGTFQ